MLLTLFVDWPGTIACYDKRSLTDFVDELVEAGEVTKDDVMGILNDSLVISLTLDSQENLWDELFDEIQPKKMIENNETIPDDDETAMTKETMEDLRLGSYNLAAEMKTHYPEIFATVAEAVKTQMRVQEVAIAAAEASNDPELMELMATLYPDSEECDIDETTPAV